VAPWQTEEMSDNTSQNDAEQAFAAARDGTRLAYRLLPGVTGRRFVLTHSLAMNGDFWRLVAEPLCQAGDVLVWDCRGHGASDKPAGPYVTDQFADDLADLMDAVGWFSAEVVGCSMGGCVSLAFAEYYPERVDALGLIDTTAWYGEDAPTAWEERGQKAAQGGMGALAEMQPARWFSDSFRSARPDVIEAALSVFLANDAKAYLESCRMLGGFDGRKGLRLIDVPTAVLVGSKDFATPIAMAEVLKRGILEATLQVIDGASHFSPLEQPDKIAAALIELGGRQE
jgi:3-oxoadipate enol-lactonase